MNTRASRLGAWFLGGPRGCGKHDSVTVRELSEELGHHDCGRAIHAFLRRPDDGGGPISGHRLLTPWRLAPEQAERVRRRFT